MGKFIYLVGLWTLTQPIFAEQAKEHLYEKKVTCYAGKDGKTLYCPEEEKGVRQIKMYQLIHTVPEAQTNQAAPISDGARQETLPSKQEGTAPSKSSSDHDTQSTER